MARVANALVYMFTMSTAGIQPGKVDQLDIAATTGRLFKLAGEAGPGDQQPFRRLLDNLRVEQVDREIEPFQLIGSDSVLSGLHFPNRTNPLSTPMIGRRSQEIELECSIS